MKKITATMILVVLFFASSGLCDEYKIDAKSKKPLQLDVTMRFNSIEPALAIEIMEHLREWYGKEGLRKEACKLQFTWISDDGVVCDQMMLYSWDSDVFDRPQGGKPHTAFGNPCYNDESDAKAHCEDGYFDSYDSDGFRYCCK